MTQSDPGDTDRGHLMSEQDWHDAQEARQKLLADLGFPADPDDDEEGQ